MHAVNHAITALVIKKAQPEAPLVLLLVSVQIMEIIWVALHFLGIESTEIAPEVRSIADIHLSHMPWSHSVLTTVLVAAVFAVAALMVRRRFAIALALAGGVVSHIVLDLALHAPDIQLAPFLDSPKLGLGFYGAAPALAWVIELIYGLAAWRVVGGKGLLWLVLLFQAISLPSYMPFLPFGGAGDLDSTGFARLVAMQIAVTLPLVYFLAPRFLSGGQAAT